MAATWCNDRGCWIVRHPQRRCDVIATGRSKAEAEAEAQRRFWEERELRA